MKAWLPYPLISVLLLATWLLLNQSLALAHILLGGALSVIGPWFLVRLDTPRLIVRRPMAVLQLCCELVVDIVRSNYRVASLILSDRPGRTPGFVWIPLRMHSQYGLAAVHHHRYARDELGRLRPRDEYPRDPRAGPGR